MSLAGSTYDDFVGGRGTLLYADTVDPDLQYPDQDTVTVLGTTLLPRVYGKDLQAFEIASSGFVAVTLNDVHSLDLARNDAESNVVLSTLCNDSLEFKVQEGTIKSTGRDVIVEASNELNMSSSNDLTISSDCNLVFVAGDKINFTAKTVNFEVNDGGFNVSGADTNTQESKNSTVTTELDYTLIVGRDLSIGVSNDTTFTTHSNHVLEVGDELKMSSSNDLTLSSDCNLVFNAGNKINFTAKTVNFEVNDGGFNVSGADTNTQESKNSTVTTELDYTLIVGRDLSIGVSNDTTFITHSNHVLEVGDELKMSSSNDLTLSSDCNLVFNAGNKINFTAKTVNFEVSDGGFNVSGGDTNTQESKNSTVTTELDYTIIVGRDLSIGVSNDTTFITHSNHVLEVGDELKMSSSNDLTLSSDCNLVFNAGNKINFTAKTVNFEVNDGGFNVSGGDTNTQESKNSTVTTELDYTLIVGRDLSIGVSNDTIFTTNSNYVLEVGDELSISASNDIQMNSQCNIIIQAEDSVSLSAGGVTFSISSDGFSTSGADSIDESSVSSVVTTEKDYTLNVGRDFLVNVDNDTMFVTKSNATFAAAADYNVTASNDLKIQAVKDFSLVSSDAVNGNLHSIDFLSATDMKFKTTGAFSFRTLNNASSTPYEIINATSSNVYINGNLNVQGVLSSTSILEKSIEVEDKKIMLAATREYLDSVGTGSEQYEFDGAINDGAGVVIHGVPQDAIVPSDGSLGDIADLYEKSLRWHKGDGGMLDLGASNIGTESRWELKGGALYLSNTKVKESGVFKERISFGFRVNQFDELELVKEVENDTGSITRKRVAKFGNTKL